MTAETIAAIATPLGKGGIGIIRLSGPASQAIAVKLQQVKKDSAAPSLPPANLASLRQFFSAEQTMIDEGLLLNFPAPASFTGEDVIELQVHGSPMALDQLLKRTLELGARMARPGEFSERAFLNGKLDLTQAEAIADLIEADSEAAATAAINSLRGDFSAKINELNTRLKKIRTYVEACLDFPEEDIDFLVAGDIEQNIKESLDNLESIQSAAKQGQLLKEGMTLVITGQPNVGKSSLLNALAGKDSAIVTDIPGTTRDVLREHLQIDGLPLHVIDTAGLRESKDPIEQEGIKRARKEIEKADRLLMLVDACKGFTAVDEDIISSFPKQLPVTLILNKIDLCPEIKPAKDASVKNKLVKNRGAEQEVIYLSAKQGAGIDDLKKHLEQCMGFKQSSEGLFIARRRHLQALEKTQDCIQQALLYARELVNSELLAEELRLASQHLAEITGEFSSEDLLGEIFSSFCIGK